MLSPGEIIDTDDDDDDDEEEDDDDEEDSPSPEEPFRVSASST